MNTLIDLATNPDHTRWMYPLLIMADAALCGIVIDKIPYTEIDWKAYMEQIAIYNKGERDYRLIEGSTGPLVYPGAHVLIYRFLYWVTEQGENIMVAQYLFGLLYLLTLTVVIQCYRKSRVPPYVFPMLVLSKRLHSIFMLRCFNDCFAVLGLFSAIYAYQNENWHLGTAFYATGLNVKMSLLLPLPAMGVMMLQALGSSEAMTQALIIVQATCAYGYPFRKRAPSYFARAFEFTRQFLYKWTVNWRFVPESVFLSRPFTLGLLSVHIGLLYLFIKTRWLKPSGRQPRHLMLMVRGKVSDLEQDQISRRITPKFIMTTILTATVIGMLCARSLHYQFYAYLAWSTPFLLWRAGFNPIVQYALWGAQEWAWNVYPSTSISSAVTVGVMAITVFGVWKGTENEFAREKLEKVEFDRQEELVPGQHAHAE